MHPADSMGLYIAQVAWGLVVMATTLLGCAVLVDAAAWVARAWRGDR